MGNFELTDRGHVPAGIDVAVTLDTDVPDERELLAVWNTYRHVEYSRDYLAWIEGHGLDRLGSREVESTCATLRADIETCARVTPAQALVANRRLVNALTGSGRWSVMREAREAGDSWSVIGAALQMTKQGALDWYKRRTAEYEKAPSIYRHLDRAHAVIDEQE